MNKKMLDTKSERLRKTQSELQRTGQKCKKNGKRRQKYLHGRPC